MNAYPIHLGCGGPLLLRAQVPAPQRREPLCCARCHAGVRGEPGQVEQAEAAATAEGFRQPPGASGGGAPPREVVRPMVQVELFTERR